jgi:hypothetical protein
MVKNKEFERLSLGIFARGTHWCVWWVRSSGRLMWGETDSKGESQDIHPTEDLPVIPDEALAEQAVLAMFVALNGYPAV